MPFDDHPPEFFTRMDERRDELFYTMPRKVVHIDNHALSAVANIYRRELTPGSTLLDLMSSWRSHIPPELDPAHVTGLGLNREEMVDNPQLDRVVIHNLNTTPQLPFEDAQFDAVLCAVSVQYLTQPTHTFAEVHRTLKPGGTFIVTFSNRCFPQKAVAVWLSTTDREHISLVMSYFEKAADWQRLRTDYYTSPKADPLYAVIGRKQP
jgi:SAM-dependent methyltransferase